MNKSIEIRSCAILNDTNSICISSWSCGDWDVDQVTTFGTGIYDGIFYYAVSFKQNLSFWKFNSSITYLGAMFRNANSFNGDLSSWDVSNIVNMEHMFNDANSFNQSLNSWNVSLVTNMENMFNDVVSFKQDL